jgi:NADPH2:quinone reductase
MQVIVLSEFGPPGVLVPATADDPVPGPGQVVIAVEFANVTFVETQLRAGRAPFPMPADALPMVPGNGVGGTVAAVGPGVDEAWLGRRVVSGTGGSRGYAERVAVAASGLIEIPAGVATDDAVALLADGRTAGALVRAAALRAGDRVLVEAAGGGVGTVLTQLCVLAGARVIGAARGADKLRLARELGAEQAVDYAEPGWAKRVRAGADGVEVVFDGVGGSIAAEAFELLGPGGRMLSYGLASGSFAEIPDDAAIARGVTLIRGVPVSPAEAVGLTRAALTEAAAGRLRPVIGQRFPLADAAAAHAAIESRSTTGKTLLVVGPA